MGRGADNLLYGAGSAPRHTQPGDPHARARRLAAAGPLPFSAGDHLQLGAALINQQRRRELSGLDRDPVLDRVIGQMAKRIGIYEEEEDATLAECAAQLDFDYFLDIADQLGDEERVLDLNEREWLALLGAYADDRESLGDADCGEELIGRLLRSVG